MALGAFLFALGVIRMSLPANVALHVLGCSTRVLDFLRRGFGGALRRFQLVGEFR
jgi:hypothetical protein